MTKRAIVEIVGVPDISISVKYSSWGRLIREVEDIVDIMVTINEIYPLARLVLNTSTIKVTIADGETNEVLAVIEKNESNAIETTFFERRQGISPTNIKDRLLKEY